MKVVLKLDRKQVERLNAIIEENNRMVLEDPNHIGRVYCGDVIKFTSYSNARRSLTVENDLVTLEGTRSAIDSSGFKTMLARATSGYVDRVFNQIQSGVKSRGRTYTSKQLSDLVTETIKDMKVVKLESKFPAIPWYETFKNYSSNFTAEDLLNVSVTTLYSNCLFDNEIAKRVRSTVVRLKNNSITLSDILPGINSAELELIKRYYKHYTEQVAKRSLDY